VWVSRLYRFSAGFPYKLIISLLLYEKAELLPVAPKKKKDEERLFFTAIPFSKGEDRKRPPSKQNIGRS
jgi:hypothetical protein